MEEPFQPKSVCFNELRIMYVSMWALIKGVIKTKSIYNEWNFTLSLLGSVATTIYIILFRNNCKYQQENFLNWVVKKNLQTMIVFKLDYSEQLFPNQSSARFVESRSKDSTSNL
jgi:hypothetical protein